MNRKIKFRMWNDYDKKMIHWNELLEKNLANIFTIPSYDKWLMQYTGLHDKNGKEIYEGDIVKALISGRWFVGKVIYEHSGFTIDVMNNKALEFGRRGIIEPWTEVIGNIYNNPELLGEQNEI